MSVRKFATFYCFVHNGMKYKNDNWSTEEITQLYDRIIKQYGEQKIFRVLDHLPDEALTRQYINEKTLDYHINRVLEHHRIFEDDDQQQYQPQQRRQSSSDDNDDDDDSDDSDE
jgi:hypothetical protein